MDARQVRLMLAGERDEMPEAPLEAPLMKAAG
jgi:hypothetical protein